MGSSLLRGALVLWLLFTGFLARLFGRHKKYAVVKIAISGDLSEQPADRRLFSRFRHGGEDFLSLVNLLRWAREDERVRGILVSLEDTRAGWARLQEIRRSLLAVRAAGKRVWVHFAHAGLREYFVASAADRVWMNSAGTLEVAGLSAEATFFLGALEKLGVEAEVVQVGRYKSAVEPFTLRSMSPEHREMMESIVDDLYSQVAEAVADGRHMVAGEARELLGRGPFLSREALESRLVDRCGYLDEAEDEMRAECGAIIEKADYRRQRGRQIRRRVLRGRSGSVAVLCVSGTVKSGESVPGPDLTSAAGATTICAELKRLEERPGVAAVVLRISSPGGSGLASDLIWRAVGRLRSRKPVVVSMGDVAASGGYYIAAAGAPVLAEGGTLTGSIGVIAGKANLRALYGKLGITKETVSRGQHAAIFSDYLPLGDEERRRLEVEARGFYDDFLGKVADGRRLSAAAVAEVAEGRVWTGRQALERRLVDRLGGLEDAIGEAKVLAGIPRDQPVVVERLPRQPRLWRFTMNLLPGEIAPHAAAWLSFTWRERLWAVLPFDIRFF